MIPTPVSRVLFVSSVAAAALGWVSRVEAHCDTMDGPVVADARLALGAGDVTPVLKWIKADREDEIRDAFALTMAVRKHDAAAKNLADRFFFETLVRVHREGEGVAYTGLKPAGTIVDPGIAAADRALEHGEVDELVHHVQAAVEEGLRNRFAQVQRTKKFDPKDVTAGREAVAAYVEFIHFAERLLADAAGSGSHHEAAASPAGHH